MSIIDILEETYLTLSSNKIRSGLTILGIVIGVASVIAMVAIGQGSQSSIESSIQSTGANLLTVMPGATRGVGQQVSAGRGSAQTLKMVDAEAIKNGTGSVSAVSPELSGRYQVTARGTNTNTSIIGSTEAYAVVHNIEVEQGVFISETDAAGTGRVAVIGSTVSTDLFGEGGAPVGQKIKIKSIEFTIIGVTKAKGGTGFNNPDDAIYVPILTAQKLLAGSTYISSIAVQAASQDDMEAAQADVTAIILAQHKITDAALADFTVVNQADVVEAASSVTNTLTLLLASIAGISLLVGGIGIMNMILTSVTERTREIGLRKAIGAHREDISAQFLSEAVALTFIGGTIGILLGILVSFLVQKFAGLASEVSLLSVLVAFGVSAGIGIVFGYYPATSASRMNPIEALRHE